jgi:hypothetical protein
VAVSQSRNFGGRFWPILLIGIQGYFSILLNAQPDTLNKLSLRFINFYRYG